MNDIVDVIQSYGLEIDTLGRALIVCGGTFVCSGLFFLLPGKQEQQKASGKI